MSILAITAILAILAIPNPLFTPFLCVEVLLPAFDIMSVMEYVNLGTTGLKVSRLCLGTMTYGSKKWREWGLEEDAGRPFILRAPELCINFFDTADLYSRRPREPTL